MSQSASLRALTRTPAARSAPPRQLRVVAGAPRGHAAMVATCLLLLTLGLVSVLLLNTSLAKGSFVLNDLQDTSHALADEQAALTHAVSAQSAPAQLAQKALKLGMVPASSPAFLRLSDGKILGVAQPAAGDGGFSVVAQATPAAPSAPAAAPTVPATPAPAASAAPAAPVVPGLGTVVTHEGTITRTTVTAIRGNVVVRTVTSVDSASGATTSTTTRTPLPAGTAAPTTH